MAFNLADLDDDAVSAINGATIDPVPISDVEVIDRDAVAELAALSPLEYDRVREVEAERLGVRTATLDKQVARKRKASDPSATQGSELELPEPEAWPDAVDGASLLTDLSWAIRQYVFMPETSATAAALWAVHTFTVDSFAISPRLAIKSPEKGCGKTTLLDVLERVSWRALLTPSIQPAGIFRVVEAWRPTLLMDEADGMNLDDNNALRSILNSGHRRGGKVIRCEGETNAPRVFKVFGACPFALIGALPDTLENRAVAIELQRAKAGEVAKQFRYECTPELEILARMARRWCEDHANEIKKAEPATDGLFNREADNWRTLFAIADTAGGDWPERARAAAKAGHKPIEVESVRVLLLSDIRDVFWAKQTDRLPSATLAEALGAIEGRPWAEWKAGRPMTATALARQLSAFKIAPATHRDGQATFKGYLFSDFDSMFERYLADPPVQTVTPLQTQQTSAQVARSEPSHENSMLRFETAKKPNNGGLCDGVTVQTEGFAKIARDADPFEEWERGGRS
jgi:putative DNA primase/helicase